MTDRSRRDPRRFFWVQHLFALARWERHCIRHVATSIATLPLFVHRQSETDAPRGNYIPRTSAISPSTPPPMPRKK